MESEPSGHVSAIYVAKYNRFVDNILGRINKILRTNYDPVTVKLTNPSTSTKGNKNKTKSKSKRKGGKNGSKKSAVQASSPNKVNSKNSNGTDATSATKKTVQALEKSTTTATSTTAAMKDVLTTLTSIESSTKPSPEVTSRASSRRTSGNANNKKKNRNRTKNRNKTKGTSNKNNNSNKQTKQKSKPRARATLYGLSSLQRSGDVSVNMMSDHTTIKTKFSLGPLVLKVEKEFGRAAKKELRSATATTAEMYGKLSLRVLHGGTATLHSIRVLQPKQVRVESADDHDRTREFVWKRSSHIAHLVSQKLSAATRSMLRPQSTSAQAA